MLLNIENIESIKNRNVTFVKQCREIESFKSHADIFNFLEFNDVSIELKNVSTFENTFHFTNSGIIQIGSLGKNMEINSLQDLILNLIYKDSNVSNFNSCIFMSMKSGSSNEHADGEDVHLFGLVGNTIYRVYYDEKMEYEDHRLSHGDYLFIPGGLKHRAISENPRAILSIGYYFS